GTGLPWTSMARATNVAVLLPSAARVLGLATNVVLVLLTGPGLNVTFVLANAAPAAEVTVFISAVVDASVALHWPELSVVVTFGESVLLEPLTEKVTACEGTGLPKASATVNVRSVVVPFATNGFGLAVNTH